MAHEFGPTPRFVHTVRICSGGCRDSVPVLTALRRTPDCRLRVERRNTAVDQRLEPSRAYGRQRCEFANHSVVCDHARFSPRIGIGTHGTGHESPAFGTAGTPTVYTTACATRPRRRSMVAGHILGTEQFRRPNRRRRDVLRDPDRCRRTKDCVARVVCVAYSVASAWPRPSQAALTPSERAALGRSHKWNPRDAPRARFRLLRSTPSPSSASVRWP